MTNQPRNKLRISSNKEIAHDIAMQTISHLRDHYPMQYENSKQAHQSLKGFIETRMRMALDDKSEIISGLIQIINSVNDSLKPHTTKVGSIGGLARAKALTSEQRKAIASKVAKARWSKRR
jgi:hypothetical protein